MVYIEDVGRFLKILFLKKLIKMSNNIKDTK